MEKVKQMETTDKKSNLVSSSLKNSEPKKYEQNTNQPKKKGKNKKNEKNEKTNFVGGFLYSRKFENLNKKNKNISRINAN